MSLSNLADTGRFLNTLRDMETGRDEREPHQIPREITTAAIEADPNIVAEGLLDAAQLLDVNHLALRSRFQLAAAVLRQQAKLLERARDAHRQMAQQYGALEAQVNAGTPAPSDAGA